MGKKMVKTFEVVIEKDEDGVFVASVPTLPGCHTQANSLRELKANIREAIEAYLESLENEEPPATKFVKIQTVRVAVH